MLAVAHTRVIVQPGPLRFTFNSASQTDDPQRCFCHSSERLLSVARVCSYDFGVHRAGVLPTRHLHTIAPYRCLIDARAPKLTTQIGSRRRTFFYLLEGRPPFAILAVTPRMSFFNATIEYATGMVREGDELVVGMGVEDCYVRYPRLQLCLHVLRRLHWREPLRREHERVRALCGGRG